MRMPGNASTMSRTHALRATVTGCLMAGALFITGCGGGGSSSGSGSTRGPESGDAPALTVTAPEAPVLSLSFATKQVVLAWDAVSEATSYRVLEDADGTANFSVIATDVTDTLWQHTVSVHRRVNARYRVQACNSAGCTDSAAHSVGAALVGAIGYFKAANAGADDRLGSAVAMDAAGTRLVASAAFEASASASNPADNTLANAGAPMTGAGGVWLFARAGSTWSSNGFLKASNTGANDQFGYGVAISADGAVIAAGAPGESGDATGIGGDQENDRRSRSGAVYLF